MHKFLFLKVIAIYRADDILHLNSVCADILNRRGTDLSRNPRKIFHTPEPLVAGPFAKIIEHDSRSNRNFNLFSPAPCLSQNIFRRLFFIGVLRISCKRFYEIYPGMQDRAFEIVCKKQVAATSDMQNRPWEPLQVEFHQIRHGIIFHKCPCLHLHPEGVKLSQILIVFSFQHRCMYFIPEL